MNLLEPYYRINEATGVCISFLKDGTVNINCCTLIARGNQLDIGQKVLDIRAAEELIKHLPPKTVIALNLSGKGVLHKQIEGTGAIGQGNFNKILPNANIDHFYICLLYTSDAADDLLCVDLGGRR